MEALLYKRQEDQARVEDLMDCDLLLAWMTHAGEGSWTSFRRCVEDLAPPGTEATEAVRRLRVSLSDLGHAEFFMEGARKWKVLPPQLCGSAAESDSAFLCGARTPSLIDSIGAAAERLGCRMERSEREPYLPQRISVTGPDDGIAAVAQELKLPYRRRGAAALVQSLEPISLRLSRAVEEPAPRNWIVRSFDLKALRWVEGLRPRSACEFTPRFGSPKYLLNGRRRRLLAMQKRESVYASALLTGFPLVSYDREAQTLAVPLSAPLPEKFARAACLCSGQPPKIADGRFLYSGVPLDIVAVLCAALGHPHPICGHPLLLGRRVNG